MSDKALREQSEAMLSMLSGLWRRLSALDADDPAMEIPGAQMRVCGILRDGPRTMSALSDDLGISHSAITQIADRLERAGMVERVSQAGDRRCKSLRLTSRGVEVMRARMERRVVRTMRVLKSLSADQRAAALSVLSALMEAGMTTYRSGGSPSPPEQATTQAGHHDVGERANKVER
jgi:DNA-binding MarR family transcriptional regulator